MPAEPNTAGASHHPDPELTALLEFVQEGWSRVTVDGRAYGVVRSSHVGGRTLSVSAEELGGTDAISANVLRTRAGDILKPCEMPAEKVMAFLRAVARERGEPGAASTDDRQGPSLR